ncbi:hypothetical protein SAMN06298216_4293 [Spirosomataceae bacterium TFI 002]|nr:hypothetical protein SAMN06298216_4293 [Spirosomataceae bacterium TFI 002]
MNESTLLWLLNYVPFIIILSSSVALLKLKYIQKRYPEILLFLAMGIFFEILSRQLSDHRINNLPYLHLYTWLEFSVIGLLFTRLLEGFSNRKYLFLVILGFSAFCLANALFIQGINNYNSYSRSLESLLIIIFCFIFYYRMFNDLSIKEPENSPDFWLVTAFFLYFTGSFVLFILSNLINHETRILNITAWTMHAFLLAILHIFISIGLWKTSR